jgi:hypothetical protein
MIEIKSGAKPGDRVIWKPPAKVKNGNRVKVREK